MWRNSLDELQKFLYVYSYCEEKENYFDNIYELENHELLSVKFSPLFVYSREEDSKRNFSIMSLAFKDTFTDSYITHYFFLP